MTLPEHLLYRPHVYKPTSQERYTANRASRPNGDRAQKAEARAVAATFNRPSKRTFIQSEAAHLDVDQMVFEKTDTSYKLNIQDRIPSKR